MDKRLKYRVLNLSFLVPILITFCVGFSASCVVAADQPATGSVEGNIKTPLGTPIAGASVALNGTASQQTTSNAGGLFSFKNVLPGSYYLVSSAKGFERVVSSSFSVVAGQSVAIAITLQELSTTHLATLGRITVMGHGQLDTSPAPTVVLSNQLMVDSGVLQIQDYLDKMPGVSLSLAYSGQTPGSPTYLSIRGSGAGGSAYENVVLEDGEPLRTGGYGLDMSSFTPAIYSGVELVKGVGGASVHGANAIGGTLNLVTRDPTKTESGQIVAALGGWGTSDFNITESNTFGRFGYIFDYHTRNTNGYNPPGEVFDYIPFAWETPGSGPTNFDQSAIGILHVPDETQILKNFLGKVRFDFSKSTYAVSTFETTADFDDYSALAGSMGGLLTADGVKHYRDPLGHTYILSFPGVFTQDLRPKYALEVHTQAFGGSLVVRSYDHHLLNIFDASTVPAETCCFWDTTRDHIAGQTLTWTRLFGRHAVTLSFSGDADNYHYAYVYGGPQYGSLASLYDQDGTYKDLQRQTLLRDDFQASQKLDLTLALYRSYETGLYIRRNDPRLGIVYRPSASDVIRFSYGTGFSIPPISTYKLPIETTIGYGSILGFTGCPASEPSCVATGGNPFLKEETAEGFDLGFQRQFPNDGLFALDLYRTNLQGHLAAGFEPAPAGLTFGPSCFAYNGGTCAGLPILYLSTSINLASFVYQGIEAQARVPFAPHFNFDARFDVQSAFPRGVDATTEQVNQYIVNNQQFLEVPLHKPSASLNYRNGLNSAYIRWTYYDRWNEFFRPPFSVYDAGANVRLSVANSLHITYSNMFSANYLYPPFYSYFNPNFSSFGSVFTYGIATANYPGYSGPYYYPANNSAPHMLTVSLETKWGALRNR